jgi:hypothetical protein
LDEGNGSTLLRDKTRKPGEAPQSFTENMASMVLFGVIITLAARSQLKVEKS